MFFSLQAMNMAIGEYQRLTAIGTMKKYGVHNEHYNDVLHHKGLQEHIEAFYEDKSIVERLVSFEFGVISLIAHTSYISNYKQPYTIWMKTKTSVRLG